MPARNERMPESVSRPERSIQLGHSRARRQNWAVMPGGGGMVTGQPLFVSA